MKLNEQKELLEQVRAGEAAALKLCNAGIKISGIYQRLRSAGDELETRVRHLAKLAPKAAKSAAPIAKTASVQVPRTTGEPQTK